MKNLLKITILIISIIILSSVIFYSFFYKEEKTYIYNEYDMKHFVHGFDYSSYLDENAKYVHFEEWGTNYLGNTMGDNPPTKIIYKNPDGTYFAIEYCRYIPNEVTIYEKFTKDDIRIEKITTKKSSCGHYHSSHEGVNSNDGKVWYLNNVEETIIKY